MIEIDKINEEDRFVLVLRRPDGSLVWSKDTVGRTISETLMQGDFTNKAYPVVGVAQLKVVAFCTVEQAQDAIRGGAGTGIII